MSESAQPSKLNWNQLYYFSVVAQSESLKSAAKLLNLSPSTLSEHITLFERNLKMPLFLRHGPKLTLTPAGRSLYLQTKQMFEMGQAALSDLSISTSTSSEIAIGVVPGPHLFTAHRTICDFAQELPTAGFEISQREFDELEEKLINFELSFGFTDRPSKRKEIRSHCLSTSRIRFYVSEKWKGFSLRDVLKEIPLLLCQTQDAMDDEIQKALLQVGIKLKPVIKAEYPSVLVDLCKRGLGVGAFCQDAMEIENDESIRTLQNPKDAPKIESHAFILWPKLADASEAVAQINKLIRK